ncbi:LIM domain only protein 7-like isoform X1 [Penaeus monodon]|uniref:LIM domain only protein 7-like isoform X1 n=1 Tax=Penaeus monodon TaxID=6687 RepID=UPI0018A7677B|nr:LIM domain only protein 7-like isoform X1 [Penaeus monodon]
MAMTSAGTMEKTAWRQGGATDVKAKMTQMEYNDQLETHNLLISGKSQELTKLGEELKRVREKKEPLTKAKDMLQEEINKANKAINAKSEEVTLLKQKLRYHSVKQIHENIDRLEYQLRNNSYKPREEQKILNEISMLQRSIRTLREYEAKQAENKKYRAERTRLIDERNSNFTKIRALYEKEDELKKEMAQLREVLSVNKKAIENLRQLRPSLEQAWLAQKQQSQAARQRRIVEKKRMRQDQIRERQEQKRRLWEEYEASREPYEEERDLCRLLISYLQSSVSCPTPVTPGTPSNVTPLLTPVTPTSTGNTFTPTSDDVGSFYLKSKEQEESFSRISKREKARLKRQQKMANRVKELPHTPDVLEKFSKLSIIPPRNTDEIPATVIALQDCLQHLNVLAVDKSNQKKKEEKQKESDRNVNPVNSTRPTSLAIRESNIFTPDIVISTTVYPSTSPDTYRSEKSAEFKRDSPTPTTPSAGLEALSLSSLPSFHVPSSPTSWAVTGGKEIENRVRAYPSPVQDNVRYILNGIHIPSSVSSIKCNTPLQVVKSKTCNDIIATGNNESFFSLPVSYPTTLAELNNNNHGRSYAAKVKTGTVDV